MTFEVADVFTWEPTRTVDTIFMSYFLSHVPPALEASFVTRLGRWLAPGGHLVMVDQLRAEAGYEERWVDEDRAVVSRRLHDGSEHRAIKVFRSPEDLVALFQRVGLHAEAAEIAERVVGAVVTR